MKPVIKLDKFHPREYQKPIIDAVFNKKCKNIYCIMPRRSGKDITTWNICIKLALEKTCLIYYILPTYSQAKKAIWQAISNDGVKFLDYIPKVAIKALNGQEMKVTFYNNSIIQCIGGDSYNTSLVGSNPYVCVFSEWSLMDKEAYDFASPILAANNGIAIFLYTPRGYNHAYKLHMAANKWPDWFVYYRTLDDTKHITKEALAKEREKHSEEFIQQEWFCSYIRGVEGAIYGRYLDELRAKQHVTNVDWEPSLKVHTAWDLGNDKNMAVIFFQVARQEIRIIDTLQLKDGALPEYIAEVKKKPYIYGKHFGPHDIQVREMGTNITRWGIAYQLGINFDQVPDVGIANGIEATKAMFHRLWIDENKCEVLLRSIENYRREFDEKKQEYSNKPVRDWTNHMVDSLRYMALSIDNLDEGLTPKQLQDNFNKARGSNNKSSIFDQPNPFYR